MNEPEALAAFEDAAHWLAILAEHPPVTTPRPPWWRSLARRRHLHEHDDALASWAEVLEEAAEDYRDARSALDVARWRSEVFG